MFVPFCKMLSTLKEHVLGILSGPPKSISILIRTAPLRFTGVIVENNHQSTLSYNLNGMVKYLHCSFPFKLWVGFDELLMDDIVLIKQLERISESYTVHFEFISDIQDDIF